MNSEAIYKLANELTDEQVDKILSDWNIESNSIKIDIKKEAKEKIRLFNSLVRLGDSKELACATTLSKEPMTEQQKQNYLDFRFAYLGY